MRTTKLLNDPAKCVSDAIDGICLSNPRISRVKGLNVLVRSDIEEIKEKQVTLISGGGSGHEPAHAGYIGQGMLAGAVLGNVFASPPVHAILAAIRVCAGNKGVLLIIKNYTGDRLNFGMAVERARAEGIDVDMVVVDDDCALPVGKGITGARGVAGTVFVHKIAGAEAIRPGSTLRSVAAAARSTIDNVVSYGMAIGLCAVPGSNPADRLADNEVIEVGIGIHAEAGKTRKIDPSSLSLSSSSVRHILNKMLGTFSEEDIEEEGTHILPRLDVNPGDEIAVLLNNLGGISELELLVIVRDVLLELERRNIQVVRCYIGSFMTSLEMAGFSVSLLKVRPSSSICFLPALDCDTAVNVWRVSPELGKGITSSVIQYNADIKSPIPTGGGKCEVACVHILSRACEALQENASLLDEYDEVCGDGDCGRVMMAAASHIKKQLEDGFFTDVTEKAVFCFLVAEAVSDTMGGTSGAIAEIMLRAMVAYFTSTTTENVSWSAALHHGVEAICTYGGARVGMRTLLDALEPAVSSLASNQSLSFKQLSKVALDAARLGMESTMDMESLAGRANYVNHEKLKGTPDPGAYAVYLIFQAARSYFEE